MWTRGLWWWSVGRKSEEEEVTSKDSARRALAGAVIFSISPRMLIAVV